MTLRTVLLSLQALLQDPRPDDPQDSQVNLIWNNLDIFDPKLFLSLQVAKQLLNNKEEFIKTAHYWKMFFATDSTSADRMKQHPEFETKFLEFKNHPISKETRKTDTELLCILSSNYWDLNKAIRYL